MLSEAFARGVQFTVMIEVVDADLEPIFRQPVAQLFGNAIIPFRDEVKRGPEPKRHVEFSQLLYPRQAAWPFHVVGQNDRELFAIGPPRPAGWGLFRTRVNGPDMAAFFQLALRQPPPHRHAQPPRDMWLAAVIL